MSCKTGSQGLFPVSRVLQGRALLQRGPVCDRTIPLSSNSFPINKYISTPVCEGLQVWALIPTSLSGAFCPAFLWGCSYSSLFQLPYISQLAVKFNCSVIPCFLLLLGLYSSVGIYEQNLARKAVHLNKMSRLLPPESLCSPPQKFQLPLQLLCYVTVCSTFGAM